MQMTPRDFADLLAQTPDIPENAGLIAALQSLAGASKIIKYTFTYNAVFYTAGGANNLAAGATSTVNVNIDAGAPFLIVSQTYDANTANAARAAGTLVVPNIIALITDTGSNRALMDVATPVPAIFGTGQFPYILPEPKLMPANSQLQVQVTNIDAAAGYNLRLCFNGYKLYKA